MVLRAAFVGIAVLVALFLAANLHVAGFSFRPLEIRLSSRVNVPTPTPIATEEMAAHLPLPTGKYPWHENIRATVFWIGEDANSSNANISNAETFWDDRAQETFGGVDGLADNLSFSPGFNRYYAALPAADYRKENIEGAKAKSYWTIRTDGKTSAFKGRWIQVVSGQKTSYVQWADVGPYLENDFDYVFGLAKPKNPEGLRAGLDLSPLAAKSLGFTDGYKLVAWRFVDAEEVPNGAWSNYPPISNLTNWH